MGRMIALQIRKFKDEDQDAVGKLILDGMIEHWGFLDPSKNPDLVNISKSYKNALFLVAELGSNIIGCGALKPLNSTCAEIVRMSISKSYRRQGIGSLILNSLVTNARILGFDQINLETTSTWLDAITFYTKLGFEVIKSDEQNIYFSRRILM